VPRDHNAPMYSPEIAWKFDFFDGSLSMSWRACQAYGLEPHVDVRTDIVDQASEIPEPNDRYNPYLSINLVAPGEINPTANSRIPRDEEIYKFHNFGRVGVSNGLINAVVGLQVKQDDPSDYIAHHLKSIAPGSEKQIDKILAGEFGKQSMMAQVVTEVAKGAAKEGFVGNYRLNNPDHFNEDGSLVDSVEGQVLKDASEYSQRVYRVTQALLFGLQLAA
jgi:hypothetical protein